MEIGQDSYRTLAAAVDTITKEKGSKFLAFAYPVEDEEQIKQHIEVLTKKYYDATHHCYAWRIGPHGEQFRANDNGEPSGTAGKPILGQLLSKEITNALVVVVRYFGGTKLGVSGLISTYREAAAEVLELATIIVKTVDIPFTIRFGYLVMNDVMRVIKEDQPNVLVQEFDNTCNMELSIRAAYASQLRAKLEKIEGIEIANRDE